MENLVTILAKILLALLVGGLVGLERERQYRPAGLRTHMLVCGGSALTTLVSVSLGGGEDRTRIAAQIVSGIGFLGAGTIFRSGTAVRGLTTAAGLWVVAGLGMAIAAGGNLLVAGVVLGGLVYGINHWLRIAETRFLREYRSVTITASRGTDALAHIIEGLAERHVEISRVRWLAEEVSPAEIAVMIRLRLSPRAETTGLTAWMTAQPGVIQVEWDT